MAFVQSIEDNRLLNEDNFNDDPSLNTANDAPWKVIIVDDEPTVHEITKLVLSNLQYESRNIELTNAYTYQDARAIIEKNPNRALVLLDVVMEHDGSDQAVTQNINDKENKKLSCIVLRAGQPDGVTRHDVITNYDVNAYEPKSDTKSEKSFTVIYSSLRSYRDLISVKKKCESSTCTLGTSKERFLCRA